MGYFPHGWRRAAVLNTIGIFVFAALVTGLLSWSSSKSGGVNANFIFYEGNCATSNNLNLWLHLLLNVFSTGVLASSNFFMQVVSSPSRNEIDVAHRKNTAMEIGVPSFKNIFYVSRFKMVAWLLFFGSSIPIHLFFNSAIFSTEYQGSQWNLTMASEGFVQGAQYFPPGAIMWPAGGEESGDKNRGDEGYGFAETLNTYFDSDSSVVKTISFTAESASTWRRIEVPECLSQYQYCSSRTKYGDVVMVVRSNDSDSGYMVSSDYALGWTRDGVIAPLSYHEENIWNRHVPANESNSLWFTANCSTTSDLNPRTHRAEGCFQTCNAAYGQKDNGFGFLSADKIPATYTFDFFPRLPKRSIYNITWPGLSDPNASILDLEYCLAQEIHPNCKVGLANKPLLIVIICIGVKTLLCILVVLRLFREDPLVVPGDAIASFITYPDEVTEGWCTADRSLARKAFGKRAEPMTVQPLEWHREQQRWFKAVPWAVWMTDYLLFLAVIIFVGAMFGSAQSSNPIGTDKQSLSHSSNNGILNTEGSTPDELLSSVIIANLPQLLLSFSYFVYNSLYTRLCVEKEWNSYSINYRTLRVTSPQGQQRSTYRLQLPYRYSIPLIIISILLHWLVSNALYVFILEGGYYWVDLSRLMYQKKVQLNNSGTGLSDDAYVGIGYSAMPLLIILLVACALASIPIILGAKQKQGAMVVGGSNSFVISAACHVPILEEEATASAASLATYDSNQITATAGGQPPPPYPATKTSTPQDSDMSAIEMDSLLQSDMEDAISKASTVSDSKSIDGPETGADLEVLSQGPLRWGVVKMPVSFYEQFLDMDAIVGHLSFGGRRHRVEDPREGHWYI